MNEPQEVTVTVREFGFVDEAHWPPHNLKEAIAAFQAALEEIPELYRDSASIDFAPRYEFGESYEHVSITYERPENAEETAARIAAERGAMTKWIEEQEALIRRRKAELEIA